MTTGPAAGDVVTEDLAPAPVSMRRAMAFMTSTSMLVPVIGVVTAPVLARALGVEGRGDAAAALAPQALVAAVATLGLPEALTYHLARRPGQARRALASSAVLSTLLGILCWTASWAFADFLTDGNSSLVWIMLVGTALAVPQMLVGLLRGAAAGLQMWGAIAAERALSSLLRLFALVGLALTGVLDVAVAVVVISVVPILTGAVYWKVLRRGPAVRRGGPAAVTAKVAGGGQERAITVDVLAFGSRTWLGAVASMVTGRVAQLLTAPLAGTTQLGLLVVAITISDVVYILVTAVRDTLFGVNAAFDDRDQLIAISRIATLLALLMSLAIGATVPIWIGLVFGEQFTAALVPTWWLLGAAVTNVPGLMAGAGLGAWGRPGLRSLSFVVALIALVAAFVALVPSMGAVGAGIAGVISGVAMSTFSVLAAARVNRSSPWHFVVPRGSDVLAIWSEGRRVLVAVGRKVPRFRL